MCKCLHGEFGLPSCLKGSVANRQIPKLRISPLPPNRRKQSQMHDGYPLHSSISKSNFWINLLSLFDHHFRNPPQTMVRHLLILKISPGYEQYLRYTNSTLCHLFTTNHVSLRKQDTWRCQVGDQSILVNAIHQGCKDGGPMELIRWWESVSPDANRFQAFFLWLAGSDCHQLAAKNSNHTYRSKQKPIKHDSVKIHCWNYSQQKLHMHWTMSHK